MTTSAGIRRLALTLHITTSVGWLGAVAGFLTLAVAGLNVRDQQLARSAFVGMGLLISYLIVPLALSAFVTGLVSSLATRWNVFHHYWVLAKLVLTSAALLILALQVEPIRALAATAAAEPASAVIEVTPRPFVHAAGGLLVLLVIQVLGVYKPRGLTPFGWRKSRDAREAESD